jgi:fumarate reductase flavoprotein subunit
MHSLPRRNGSELVDALRASAEAEGIPILTNARATTLYVDDDKRVCGVGIQRGIATELLGCSALVLACNGYGGNKDLVRRHIPGLADAHWFGHSGNDGDAIAWGEQLGASMRDMSGHQGHGSVAVPQNILITWATITEGGFQVNLRAERFSDESKGYSEQGAVVLAQPERLAWTIFDARIAAIARQFEDFRNAEAQGAILSATTIDTLALRTGLPGDALRATCDEVAAAKFEGCRDQFGRNFAGVTQLNPEFCAVKVTGALFHTQGGLAIDSETRVMSNQGTPLPNLFAAGGAAAGVSGPEASGYLSGNGLLTAVGLGWLAGQAAARAAQSDSNNR